MKSPFFHPRTHSSSSSSFSVTTTAHVERTPGGTQHRIIIERSTPSNTTATTATSATAVATPVVVIKEQKTGIAGCSANLINAILGSGIVGIPFALRQAGLVAGCVLLLGSAWLAEKTLRLLIGTAKHAHTATYETVAEAAFGIWGFRALAGNILIVAWGAVVSYMLIFKDCLPAVLGLTTDLQRNVILWTCSLAIMLPLSCQRDMANLAFTSRISVALDLILVAMVLYHAALRCQENNYEPIHDTAAATTTTTTAPWYTHYPAVRWETLPMGLGVLSFAFVCQHSAFLVAGSLERPTMERWSAVTRISLSSCAAIMLIIGLAGYLGYNNDVHGNILTNLPPHAWTANLARGLLGTCMLLVYPMMAMVVRHGIVTLCFQGRLAHEGNAESLLLNRKDRRIGLSIFIYLMAVLPATYCNDLGTVLAITGAIGCSCLSFVGPGAVYLAIHGQAFLDIVAKSRFFGTWYHQRYSGLTQKEQDNSQANDTTQVKHHGKTHPTSNSSTAPGDTSRIPQETTPLMMKNDIEQPASDESTYETSVTSSIRQVEEEEAGVHPDECATKVQLLLQGLQSILAWVLLMPLWCKIASLGRVSLEDHMHQQALKSPHPLRIGNVEYSKTDHQTTVRTPIRRVPASPARFVEFRQTESHDIGTDRPGLSSSTSLRDFQRQHEVDVTPKRQGRPLLGSGGGREKKEGLSINRQIGQRLWAEQQQKQQRHRVICDEPLEPDLEANPTTYDFLVAIGLILFGVVAMLSGLWSLAQPAQFLGQ